MAVHICPTCQVVAVGPPRILQSEHGMDHPTSRGREVGPWVLDNGSTKSRKAFCGCCNLLHDCTVTAAEAVDRELDECGLAGDRKTIDFPVKSRGKVSILYPGRLESAVWPGPHALTTRVKRCEPAHTGFRRCEPAHTRNIRLSSGVALVTRKKYRFCTREGSRRFRDDFTSKKCPRCGLGHTH